MPLSFPFDWKKPEYGAVLQWRRERLNRLKASPEALVDARTFYQAHPAEFINHWGMTVDPRNVERGLPAAVPFLLFPRQEEWVSWFLESWKGSRPGITEKSRDMGMSWLTIALSCTLCLFNRGVAVGFGSRKEEYVDKIGSPKSLFERGRLFMQNVPRIFAGNWSAPHMRIQFHDTGSFIGGEAGDEIGRGDRTSFYFVDEAAFLEHPEKVDGALSQTTNCRIDVSTPNGLANTFAQKRFSPAYADTGRVFTFHWMQDPRKDQAWYDKQVAELDPVIVAQEIDLNYSASVEGVVIPNAWIQAAIDADKKLGFEITGDKFAALDVADEGADKNALAGRHGVKLNRMKSWSGAGSTIFKTVEKAFALLDEWEQESFLYDGDGLGAGVRGDAQQINSERDKVGKQQVSDQPFRGSAAVWRPEAEMVKKRKNKDYFMNLKAQSWWALRLRFEKTYKAVVEKQPFDPDDLIVIDSQLPELVSLIMELSQPTWQPNTVGKIVIDKVPDGMKSPNLADAVMILFNPATRGPELWRKLAS